MPRLMSSSWTCASTSVFSATTPAAWSPGVALSGTVISKGISARVLGGTVYSLTSNLIHDPASSGCFLPEQREGRVGRRVVGVGRVDVEGDRGVAEIRDRHGVDQRLTGIQREYKVVSPRLLPGTRRFHGPGAVLGGAGWAREQSKSAPVKPIVPSRARITPPGRFPAAATCVMSS